MNDTRDKEFPGALPLYPKLREGGEEEAVVLVEWFKAKLVKAAEEAIANLYTDLVPHIESDAWTNFRNDLMDGLKNYRNRKVQGSHNFKEIRQAILREYYDEIVMDLNQDLVKEVADLKRQLEERQHQRC